MIYDSYKWSSTVYDLLIEPSISKLKRVGMALCPAQPGLKVLDIGCGTGSLLELYAKGGAEVWGIDASPSMLAVARRKLGDEGHLELADALSGLRYPDEKFDQVCFTMVLHELPPAARTLLLREAVRVLGPSGRILAIDFHDRPPRTPQALGLRAMNVAIERLAGREHFAGYRHFMANGALPGLATRQGLRVEDRRTMGDGAFAICVFRPMPSSSGAIVP